MSGVLIAERFSLELVFDRSPKTKIFAESVHSPICLLSVLFVNRSPTVPSHGGVKRNLVLEQGTIKSVNSYKCLRITVTKSDPSENEIKEIY